MRRIAALATTILAGLVFPPAVRAADWPTYAGGPRRLFFNPAETTITRDNVARLRVKWQFPTGAIVTASPSVVTIDLPGEGPTRVVFIPSWDRTLYALRLRDGREVWRKATPDHPGQTFPNAASVDVTTIDGVPRVFFPSGQTLYALDARTGAELWRFDAGTGCADPPGLCGYRGERNQIESSPLVADGKVFFGMDVNDREGGKGGFYAVDVRDGRLVWFFDLESGMTCRPDPGDDIRRYDGYHSEVELGLPPGFLATRAGCDHPRTPNGCGNVWSSAAFDAARGRLFTASSNCDTDDNPESLKPPPPMPPYDEAVFALALDGTPVWRWRPREVDNNDLAFGAVPNLFTIDVDGTPRDVVGIGNKDGTYYVIDRDGTNVRNNVRWDDPDPSGLPYWRRRVVEGGVLGGIIATAAVDEANRRIYFSTAPGNDVFNPQRPTVHALDADTGAIVWQNDDDPTADASFAPTSAIPGVVFIGGVLGSGLRFFDATTGRLLGSNTAAPLLASAPAVVDGHVLFGGGSGQRSANPNDLADIQSRVPTPLTALCVPGTPACDEDGDGADFPDDCDDRDPRRAPGAREVAGNDVDEDCDGLVARRDDACRAAGSASQDGRDIQAVRREIDERCTCGAGERNGGGGRRAYERCARRVIRSALSAGTLRRQCKALLLAATCGRSGSAVCCVARRKDGERLCRVTAASRCTTTRRFIRAIAAGATHCADVDCALVLPTTSTTSTTTTTTTTGSASTSTTLPASWARISAELIQPSCGGCHGSSGGLAGLGGLHACRSGRIAMVGVASTQLPTMALVEPGNPARSWLMHKLDGTQGDFTAQCVGRSCGGVMPVNQAQFTAAERDAIRAWIAAGAPDDCP